MRSCEDSVGLGIGGGCAGFGVRLRAAGYGGTFD